MHHSKRVYIFFFFSPSTFEWMKEYFQTQMTALTVVPLTPLLFSNTLHPSCFPSCECGRHWSVEAYNDARRNPRAWVLDENLFRVCECQVLYHPAQFCCTASSCLHLHCLCVALARVDSLCHYLLLPLLLSFTRFAMKLCVFLMAKFALGLSFQHALWTAAVF